MKALYEHCTNVYHDMLAESLPETPEDPDSALLYEGHLTKLVQRLELSTPYYTSVIQALKQMGCIEQLRRGGGNALSRWRLFHEPTEEAFNVVDGRKRPRTGTQAALEQQVRDLTGRVQLLELAVGLAHSGD
jgi:hypothetical protein